VEEARGSTANAACYSKTNSWKRNWKWFVPLGCFTMALLFRVRWIGTCDRLQRDEIDGRLQGCVFQRKWLPDSLQSGLL